MVSHNVGQADLELRDLIASASQVLGLKVCTSALLILGIRLRLLGSKANTFIHKAVLFAQQHYSPGVPCWNLRIQLQECTKINKYLYFNLIFLFLCFKAQKMV